MIPKLNNVSFGPNYNWREKRVTQHAPFGTNDTPKTSVKIIGGRLVVVENNSNTINSKADGPSSGIMKRTTPTRLNPLQGKPPDDYQAKNEIALHHQQYSTQSVVDESSRKVNSHSLLPPIPRNSDHNMLQKSPDELFQQNQSDINLIRLNSLGLDRFLRDVAVLPNNPVRLSLAEESELKQRVADDIQGLPDQSLKDVYIELTKYDHELTGYVLFTDLSFALLKNQVNLSVSNQRLVAALFVSNSEPKKINYEKFLYFLSSAMKQNDLRSNSVPYKYEDRSRYDNSNNNNRQLNQQTSLATTNSNHSRDILSTSQLLRVVEQQLKGINKGHLDIDHIWDVFRYADSNRSQMLSREQIKALAYKCDILLDEDILDQVIDRCQKSNNLYRWEQFLSFLGQFLVHKTGLCFPDRKKPKEYSMKNIPEPNFGHTQDQTKHDQVLNEDQLAALEKKEEDIKRLENIIQMTRERLAERKRMSTQPEPWMIRFMALAYAMYEFDQHKSGRLTAMEARWLAREFSKSLSLGFPDEMILSAVRQCIDESSQTIPIEPLLRILLANG